MSAGTIASVSGNLIRRRARTAPAVDRDHASDALDVVLDHVHADAAARDARDRSAVEKPGSNTSSTTSASLICAARSTPTRPRSSAFARTRAGSMPAPSSLISTHHVPALVARAQSQRPFRRLAREHSRGARLDPVIDGVAHDVRQRILDRLDDRTIEPGLGAVRRVVPACRARWQIADERGRLLQIPPILGHIRVRITLSWKPT